MGQTDLPQYKKPPIYELVLDVQIEPAPEYQQIFVSKFWDKFKDEFPIIEEREALDPSFVTFGRMHQQNIQFGLMQGPRHNRYCFKNKTDDELMQFQNDRLLYNWRSNNSKHKYPSFGIVLPRFKKMLEMLEKFLQDFGQSSLIINQCSLRYINHIHIDDINTANKYFNIINFDENLLNDFSFSYTRIIADKFNDPYCRLEVNASSGLKNNHEIIALDLSISGAPNEVNIESSLASISEYHNIIVNEFTKITTKDAHNIWERII